MPFILWPDLHGGGVFYILIYLVLNLLYSSGLKDIPLLDITVLASGFVLRVMYGAFITHVVLSDWFYLTIFSGAFFLGLGKRRNERKEQEAGTTRTVLKYYTYDFLDRNMYVCLGLTNTFYALWAIEQKHRMIWTVPVFMIILMKYSLNVEGNPDGDPIEVFFKDKGLMVLGMIYFVCISIFIYMN